MGERRPWLIQGSETYQVRIAFLLQVHRELTEQLQMSLGSVPGVPVIPVSALHQYNLASLMDHTIALHAKWVRLIPRQPLNEWLALLSERSPPGWYKGKRVQIRQILQVATAPPTFHVWTNLFGEPPVGYQNFLRRNLQEEFQLNGIPIRFRWRTTLRPKPGRALTPEYAARWMAKGRKQAALAKQLLTLGGKQKKRNLFRELERREADGGRSEAGEASWAAETADRIYESEFKQDRVRHVRRQRGY